MSASHHFENKIPTHRRKKELLLFILISILAFSVIYFYSYIKYLPITLTDYPRIYIISDKEPNYDDYTNCTFEMNCKNPEDSILPIDAEFKIRGSNTNWNEKSPKKGYRLSLSQRKSLLGMREDDDWLLFAMYYDFPKMRIKLCFDVWNSLEDTNPTAVLPDSEYVCLFINGEFKGLYLLAERNDRRLFDLDDEQNNLDSSLIFHYKDYWEQDWPNNYEEIIIDTILPNLYNLFTNTSDEEFFDPDAGIYSKFDKVSLIDFYIYNFFILHRDFWHSNYFIVRNTNPSKFFLVPWDFDNCFGQFGGRFHNSFTNDEEEIRNFNELYDRLLNNKDFKQDCKNRWNYLREELWTDEFFSDLLSEIYDDIEYLRNVDIELWEPYNFKKSWEGRYDDSVNHLFHWIPERLQFCDLYFAKF